MPLTQVDQGLLSSTAQYTGFKNRIINGGMVIDQRNAGAAVNFFGGSFPVDRMRLSVNNNGSGVASAQQNLNSLTPPAGFTNYIGTTVTTASTMGASEAWRITQRIEGYNVSDFSFGTASATSVSLSFWVRSNLTGTFGGSLSNSAGNRCCAFSYSISSANTWEYKTVTLPGDTAGTWLTTNGIGLLLSFSIGAGTSVQGAAGSWGSTFLDSVTGQVNVLATIGNTFYITGVQLEKGSTATSFDYRPYGTELALCQRYYYRSLVSSVTNQMTWLVGVVANATTAPRCIMRHPVTMRATPTFGYNTLRIYDGSAAPTVTGIPSNQCSPDMVHVDLSASGGGLTTGRVALILESGSTSYIDCTAEL